MVVLNVTLEAPNGDRWHAIGGGESVDDALAFAVASAPTGTSWCVVGWGELYGE